MNLAARALLAMLLLGAVDARAQPPRGDPHVGYVCPAGGRQRTTFRVTVGGQNLRGVRSAYFTGEGVRATVLEHFPPLRRIDREQRDALAAVLRGLVAQRWAELHEAGQVGPVVPWRELGLADLQRVRAAGLDAAPDTAAAEPPKHPVLHELENRDLRGLRHAWHTLAVLRKGPPNAQIAESVLIEVTIDRDAPPGDRELRLGGRFGLTNPMVFEVGVLPEFCELEDNSAAAVDGLPAEPPLELPIVINGQIMPGDVDRFRFRAGAGQGLVIETHARRLIPYLADAVPGWFQATLSVYDAAGNEVAFADDYRFDPDPVLFFEVPADGEYELEIRDAIYRGREDFVYRITLGEQPFITSLFPLGTRVGHKRYVHVSGWNLSTDRLLLDPERAGVGTRQTYLGIGKRTSNRVIYAVDALSAVSESESNDTPTDAQRIAPPRIVDGRIDPAGDVDVFQFTGRGEHEVVAEVVARRLNSPLDALLRLTDAAGNVLAWNDDHEHKDGFLHLAAGVLTHSADPYLRTRLPADGVYCVHVADAQGRGGPAYGYRLRVGPPQPDFALRVTPSSVNVAPRGAVPLCVYVLRKDGFDGEIELVLDDPPGGFHLSGARIPGQRDSIRVTLTAPREPPDQPVVLRLAGRATIGGEIVSRSAVPAEDMMQAFLYRHLTPSQVLMVSVQGAQVPAAEIAVSGPVPIEIPAGGMKELRLSVPRRVLDRELELELRDPPAGVTLESVIKQPDGLLLTLRADASSVQQGFEDNLIFACFTQPARLQEGAGSETQPARMSAGFLPAIPVVIVSP